MTRRPGTVGSLGAPGRDGLPLAAILLVDADDDERAMLRDALLEGSGPFDLRAVADADEVGESLARRGAMGAPTPSLVLVDLDRSGPEPLVAIERFKTDAAHRRIPVIALVRAADPATVTRAYDAGANTVLPKPVTFLALVRLMKVFTAYWLEAAALPRDPT
jgi:two-component system response regulator